MKGVGRAVFMSTILIMMTFTHIDYSEHNELSFTNPNYSLSLTDVDLLTAVGSTLFFRADDGTNGVELWKSDGTASGTVMVKDIFSRSGSSNPTDLTAVGNTLFFRAYNPSNGWGLWKSDGTSSGTVMVKDDSGSDFYLTAVGSTLFFSADDVTNGRELWKSDGTSSGTVMVKDIRSGSDDSYPTDLTAVGSTLYFRADDGTNGYELWKSDGTTSGTVMVKDIWSGSSGSSSSEFTAVGSTLFFEANDGTNGKELWKSDGTASGTVMVKDIYSRSGSSYPDFLTAVGSTLYFVANDGTNGSPLWKSDGTASGTVRVKDIYSGSSGQPSFPYDLTAVGNTLYFRAGQDDGTNGEELWKSDGTSSGTVMVKDIRSGSDDSYPTDLTAVGSTLYFRADDGTNGQELWKSDGTSAGTVMVKDIRSGSSSSIPHYLTAVGNTLYFYAVSPGIYVYELFKSDGTTDGTRPLLEPDADLDGVPDSSDDCPNTPSGDLVGSDGCTISSTQGDRSYYDVGLSSLDSIVEFTYGTTDWLGAEMEIAYSFQGSSDVLCTAPISQPNLEILVDDTQCINGEYTFLQYSTFGELRGIKQQRSLYEFSSDMTGTLLYTFSSDVTGVVNPSSYPWIYCVSTTDGKIHLLDTTKEGVLVESITPSQSAFVTSLTTDLYSIVTGSFWAGFSDGTLLEISLQHDGTEEDYWFGSLDQPTAISNSAILDIASMSLNEKINSEFSDLMVMDENTVYGLKSSNYEEVWKISASANRFTSLSPTLACTLFSANSVGDIVEYGTCDPTENNHFNTTFAFSISEELNENDCASSNAADCPRVKSVDPYYPSFIASAGSTFMVVKRDNPMAGEPEFYHWVIQMPNNSWKSDVLCNYQVLCFAKTVSSAFMDDKITYIDQTITVSGSNFVSYDTVLGVIRDSSGALVEKVPLTCTSYGTDVGCSADITFETTEVKQKILDETFEILHDGVEEYFKSKLEDGATELFAHIAIPILCTVVAGISAGASGGLAAIPVGAGCVKALWVLYKAVKSISFLMTLVSYYNIIDDGLGNYENTLFPNRYLTEIEVDGVVYDIGDTRLNRLNDISVDELASFGNKDKLEYLGFSPIDFHAMDGDEVLSDSGDLFQVTGDSSLEMLLWVDASWGDHVLVEGTDDGTYSMIGIFNDGDASDSSADDETPYFGNAFLVVIDEKTVPASQDYYDVSKSNWQEEADSPYQFASNQDCPNGSSCNGEDERDSSAFIIILLFMVILGGLGFVVYNQRSRFMSNDELIERATESGVSSTGQLMVQSQETDSSVSLQVQESFGEQEGEIPLTTSSGDLDEKEIKAESSEVEVEIPDSAQNDSPVAPKPQPRPSVNAQGVIGDDGYEWITFPPNSQAYYYRSPGSRDWVKFEN